MKVDVLKIGRSPRDEQARLIFKEARHLVGLLASGLGREKFVGEAMRVRAAFDKAHLYIRERS